MARLLFTGGHFNSALSVVDYLSEKTKHGIFWVGKKYVPNTKQLSPEYKEVNKRGIKFFDIKTGKLYRASSLKYFPAIIYNLVLIPVGFVYAIHLIIKIRPDTIVSFGGYIAVPVAIMGKLFGCKVLIHEQTTVFGLANKIIAKFSDVVCVSWPKENYKTDPKFFSKMIYTGLPMSTSLMKEAVILNNAKEVYHDGFDVLKPTVYVTGGKLGSMYLNEMVASNIEKIASTCNLIWQCGQHVGDYSYENIMKMLSTIDANLRKNIIVKEFLEENDKLSAFKSSAFIISRAGAHTIYEILIFAKPAILIPIPWASNNEQYSNAKVVENAGLAIILDQEKTSEDEFYKAFSQMLDDYDKMKIKSSIEIIKDGQAKVAHEIEKLTKE